MFGGGKPYEMVVIILRWPVNRIVNREIRGQAANPLLVLNGYDTNSSTIVNGCSRIAFLIFLCQNKTRIG